MVALQGHHFVLKSDQVDDGEALMPKWLKCIALQMHDAKLASSTISESLGILC